MAKEKDKYRYFRVEARELLEGLTRGILELERAPDDRSAVARLLRLAHTLKGAARGIGAFSLADAAAFAEPIDPSDQDTAALALDALKQRASAVQTFIADYLSE